MSENGRIDLLALLANDLGISRAEGRRILNQRLVKLEGEAILDWEPLAEHLSGKTLKVGKRREVRIP